MSHGDTITETPGNFKIIGSTKDVKAGAFRLKMKKLSEFNFIPEVYHTTEGLKILNNFVIGICGCKQD